ncbi:MAG: Alpha beta-propellor repeat-containing integrin, partial [Bacteroidetes bacterium]|nr:Alpha beta-propellor repeat-containing integrin [Bacteroidota bacterium]
MRPAITFAYLTFAWVSLSLTQEVAMQINSTQTVNFLVIDSLGRRTGVDPRGSISGRDWKSFTGIPNSNYASVSVGSLDTTDVVQVSREFVYHFTSPMQDGDYKICVIGNTLGTFDLSVDADAYDRDHLQDAHFAVSAAPIDKDSMVTYLFTYHGSKGTSVRLAKAVSPNSAIQDIGAMHKLNWLSTQSAADKYVDLFRSFAGQFQENNFGAAQATLLSVLANLKADSGTALSADAYKSLRSDAEQLLSELPRVLASMDTLISVKHRSFNLGWLADANFVKELDNGLDNAQKHLAKGDSVNAYKEVEKFQEKVNKEYEKTGDNQKKGKPRDKRFVTVEGWKFLYYNAQYIMDRLPSGKK